ncbi:hypothetical protein QAD02_008706 [Eretmocerus hayati]|uniref:Uncharacterized protein n=1 Tax=Eretmocerus hayati TaxID=131215 RepID=A0ACC2N762_9HYME|nr:hypothetical protein QAD02_008706 [Eretmocerus hayati]
MEYSSAASMQSNPTLVSDVDHLIASDAGNLTLVSDADPIASDASTHTLVSDVDHLIASDAGNLTLVSDADPIASDASTHPSVSDEDHLTASGIGDLGVTDVSTKKQAPPSKKKRPDAAQVHQTDTGRFPKERDEQQAPWANKPTQSRQHRAEKYQTVFLNAEGGRARPPQLVRHGTGRHYPHRSSKQLTHRRRKRGRADTGAHPPVLRPLLLTIYSHCVIAEYSPAHSCSKFVKCESVKCATSCEIVHRAASADCTDLFDITCTGNRLQGGNPTSLRTPAVSRKTVKCDPWCVLWSKTPTSVLVKSTVATSVIGRCSNTGHESTGAPRSLVHRMLDEDFEQLLRDYLRSGRRCAEYRRLISELSAERRRRLDRERRRDEREVIRVIREVEHAQRRRRPARRQAGVRRERRREPAPNNSPVSSPDRPQQRAHRADWAARAARLWRPLSPELMPWDPQGDYDPQVQMQNAREGHQRLAPRAGLEAEPPAQNAAEDAEIPPPRQEDPLHRIVEELGIGPAAPEAVQIHIDENEVQQQENEGVDWQQLAFAELDRLDQLAPEPRGGAEALRVADDEDIYGEAAEPRHQELLAALEQM